MEELHDIARAHHKGGPRNIKEAAEEFFDALDTNEDGEIDYSEFMEFMTEGAGYPEELCSSLFDNLDEDKNDALNFREVRTLYYVIKCGRPFCDSCDEFIPGAFFSCVTCFQRRTETYDLCHECYRDGKWDHDHSHGVRFLDNYSMLLLMRDLALTNQYQESRMSSAMVPHSLPRGPRNPPRGSGRSSSSRPIIREGSMKKVKSSLNALERAVSIGSAGMTIASVGTSLCTIM